MQHRPTRSAPFHRLPLYRSLRTKAASRSGQWEQRRIGTMAGVGEGLSVHACVLWGETPTLYFDLYNRICTGLEWLLSNVTRDIKIYSSSVQSGCNSTYPLWNNSHVNLPRFVIKWCSEATICIFFLRPSQLQETARSHRPAWKARLTACCRPLLPCYSGNARGGGAPPLSRFMPSQRTALPLTQPLSLQHWAAGCVCCLAHHFRGIPCHCRHGYSSAGNRNCGTSNTKKTVPNLWAIWSASDWGRWRQRKLSLTSHKQNLSHFEILSWSVQFILIGHTFAPISSLRKQGQREKSCIIGVISIIWDTYFEV